MGCGIDWEGSIKNTKHQKRIALFFSCIFDALDVEYDVYSEDLSGHFIDATVPYWETAKPKENVLSRTSMKLIGVSGYWYGRDWSLEFPPSDIAYRQISFVFDNTPNAANGSEASPLVTVEKILDLGAEKYRFMRERAIGINVSASEKIYVFRKGGHERVVPSGYADELLWIFYLIKQLYFPGLIVSDDYLVFRGITRLARKNGLQKALHSSERVSAVNCRIFETWIFFTQLC